MPSIIWQETKIHVSGSKSFDMMVVKRPEQNSDITGHLKVNKSLFWMHLWAHIKCRLAVMEESHEIAVARTKELNN